MKYTKLFSNPSIKCLAASALFAGLCMSANAEPIWLQQFTDAQTYATANQSSNYPNAQVSGKAKVISSISPNPYKLSYMSAGFDAGRLLPAHLDIGRSSQSSNVSDIALTTTNNPSPKAPPESLHNPQADSLNLSSGDWSGSFQMSNDSQSNTHFAFLEGSPVLYGQQGYGNVLIHVFNITKTPIITGGDRPDKKGIITFNRGYIQVHAAANMSTGHDYVIYAHKGSIAKQITINDVSYIELVNHSSNASPFTILSLPSLKGSKAKSVNVKTENQKLIDAFQPSAFSIPKATTTTWKQIDNSATPSFITTYQASFGNNITMQNNQPLSTVLESNHIQPNSTNNLAYSDKHGLIYPLLGNKVEISTLQKKLVSSSKIKKTKTTIENFQKDLVSGKINLSKLDINSAGKIANYINIIMAMKNDKQYQNFLAANKSISTTDNIAKKLINEMAENFSQNKSDNKSPAISISPYDHEIYYISNQNGKKSTIHDPDTDLKLYSALAGWSNSNLMTYLLSTTPTSSPNDTTNWTSGIQVSSNSGSNIRFTTNKDDNFNAYGPTYILYSCQSGPNCDRDDANNNQIVRDDNDNLSQVAWNWPVASASHSQSNGSYNHPTFDPNTTYNIGVETRRATAFYAKIYYAYSETTAVTSLANPPSDDSISASEITEATATINWAAAAGSATSNYAINITDNGTAIPGSPFSPGAGGAATSMPITGLKPGITYLYTIQTVNASGISSASKEQDFTTTTGILPPTNLTTTAISDTSATINWTASTTPSASYEVDLAPGGKPIPLAAGTTSYKFDNLTPSTAYTVNVYAVVGTEKSAAAATTFPTPAPAKPTQPTLTASTNVYQTTSTINWTETSTDLTGYTLTLTGGGKTLTYNPSATAKTFMIPKGDLVKGTAYTISLVATNTNGDSTPATGSFTSAQLLAPTTYSYQAPAAVGNSGLLNFAPPTGEITSFTYSIVSISPVDGAIAYDPTVSTPTLPLDLKYMKIIPPETKYDIVIKATAASGDSVTVTFNRVNLGIAT